MSKLKFVPAAGKDKDKILSKLSQIFGSVKVKEFFKSKELLITKGGPRQEVFIVSKEQFKFIFDKIKPILNKEPYCVGIFAGVYGKEYRPSMEICEKMFKLTKRNAIMIDDHAALLFSYGRDIMLKSIIKVYEPLHRVVVVVDSHENVIGLCKLAVKNLKNIKNNNLIVCKNIIDKGWYLRRGY